MTIEHRDIPDNQRHEPLGASTAPAQTVLKANGDGSTSWVAIGDLVDVSNVTMTRLIEGSSLATDQSPTAVDAERQVEFGPAVGGLTDPVMLSGDGTVTFNEDGLYHLRMDWQFGRTGGASEAILHARAKVNGVQAADTVSAIVDSEKILIPASTTVWLYVLAGTTLTFEIMRDSRGIDAGGLHKSVVTKAGWTDSPSAAIRVERLVAL